VDGADSGQRIDKYLVQKIPGVSRARVQGLIRIGHIRVNGDQVLPSRKVLDGDVIEGEILHEIKQPQPEAIPLDILYEDKTVLVVNKQPNLTVHPTPNRLTGTLVNGLLYHGCSLASQGGALRPGIVHRLDKGTSGVMVIAKSEEAHTCLAEQFRAREVMKTYLALTWGEPSQQGIAHSIQLSRHPRRRLKMEVNVSSEGRWAVTTFRVKDKIGNISFVEAVPRTGRTHQIRAHLAHLGSPIVGDALYGQVGYIDRANPLPKSMVRRAMLHAYRIIFHHPSTGERVAFQADVPGDMKRVLVFLREARDHVSS